jgi:ribosomal protein S27AE
MVIHTYIDNSSNHTPTNTYYRDSPISGRSPIKANVFHRYINRKKKWCPIDGRALVYFKEAQCWSCTECGHTEYIEQTKQQTQQQQGIGGVMSVDGLSDVRTTPNRDAMRFRSIKDPRSRFLKKKPEVDDELARILSQGATLVSYHEQVQQSNDVLTQDELKANK